MKVILDHQAFCIQNHGGVSRCFAELYKYLPNDIQALISIKETDNVYLRQMSIAHPIDYEINKFPLPSKKLFTLYCRLRGLGNLYHYNRKLYNQAYTIKLLKDGKYDVFHPTFFDDYFLPYIGKRPFVLTIHDMIPFIYDYLGDNRWQWQTEKIKKLAPLASAIVTVSENTKKDVIHYLNIPEEKIYVIHHGCSFVKSKIIPEKALPQPYVLYVGTRHDVYKNFVPFIKHFSEQLHKDKTLRVVCTGKDFTTEEYTLFKSLGIERQMHHVFAQDDEHLFQLYANAKCLIFPSEYEGFGMPILEAWQADCPVMLQAKSCFPEIAGNAAIYFTLSEGESNLNDRFEELCSMSDTELNQFRNLQQCQLSKFSWKNAASQLAKVYKTLI